ncbi:hypothetical protein M9Y10_044157 [Tritrichomonas musculus]|uniref:Uncharacterized protein n=1 Tax=Tritrichomonas musculus TaxID=1915356 RepID=A0ABR2K1N6_9EUKA
MGEQLNYFLIVGIALSVIVLIVVTVWAIVKCATKCSKKKNELDYDANLSTQQLIPPIFYTDEIKDPLLQDDLMEKIPKDK